MDEIAKKGLGEVFQGKEEKKPEPKIRHTGERRFVQPTMRQPYPEYKGSWHKAQEKAEQSGHRPVAALGGPVDKIPPFLQRQSSRTAPMRPDYKMTEVEIDAVTDQCFRAVIQELDWNRIVLNLKDHDHLKDQIRQLVRRSKFMSGEAKTKLNKESTLVVEPVQEKLDEGKIDKSGQHLEHVPEAGTS